MPTIKLNVPATYLLAGSVVNGDVVTEVSHSERDLSICKREIVLEGTVTTVLLKKMTPIPPMLSTGGNPLNLAPKISDAQADKGMNFISYDGYCWLRVPSKHDVVIETQTSTSLRGNTRPGTYVEAFAFTLPADSPATLGYNDDAMRLEGRIGMRASGDIKVEDVSISYTVRARVEYRNRTTGELKELISTVPITVEPIALPKAITHISATESHEFKGAKGILSANLVLRTNTYKPRDLVEGFVVVNNNSNTATSKAVFKITKRVTISTAYSKGDEAMLWFADEDLCTFQLPKTSYFDTSSTKFIVPLPPIMTPTIAVDILEVKYFASVLVFNGNYSPFEMKVPIYVLSGAADVIDLPEPKPLPPIPVLSTESDRPLTDIKVMFISFKEKVPAGYTQIQRIADNSRSANLNAGTKGFLGMASEDIFLCTSQAATSPPITNIGIFNVEKDKKAPSGWTVINKTITGEEATLNAGNSGMYKYSYRLLTGDKIFLCLKREPNVPPIMDVKVIITDEEAQLRTPAGYERVARTVTGAEKADCNKGATGKFIYLCVKRASSVINLADQPPSFSDCVSRDTTNVGVDTSSEFYGVRDCDVCFGGLTTCIAMECGHVCMYAMY